MTLMTEDEKEVILKFLWKTSEVEINYYLWGNQNCPVYAFVEYISRMRAALKSSIKSWFQYYGCSDPKEYLRMKSHEMLWKVMKCNSMFDTKNRHLGLFFSCVMNASIWLWIISILFIYNTSLALLENTHLTFGG